MSLFDLIASLITLAAVFSYLNYTLLRLPQAIGLMALSLAGSLILVLVGHAVPGVEHQAKAVVRSVDLNQAFLHGMLGFMLFAGSLQIDLWELASRKWTVAVLSTVGVLISTAVVGLLTWGLLSALGIPVRLIYCLLFGALISPTDPIAVLAILRLAGVPKATEIKIAGESLFNDGVGVVVFLGILEIAVGEGGFDPVRLAGQFVREAVGGAALGLLLGWATYRMLRSVDNYQVEVLLSLALVAGGYALADQLHTSGPIAMVVAGLIIGNTGRAYAMSPVTVEHIDTFWELIDEVLNAVLFVLIGLEVLVIVFRGGLLLAGLLTIPIVLFGRLVSVWVPVSVMWRWGRFPPHTVRLLTWGGLRGGISVALALSIPTHVQGEAIHERKVLIAITYLVVVFSIFVQGLTIGPLSRRWLGVKPTK
ncbi:MAG TPA: sodium:proton antiporter [Fimbriiglobus sp.]|jgi:CPA1 family monovalent cation:H+ antiporter